MTVIRDEPHTLAEICEPFEGASNMTVFEMLMAVTANVPPGVKWHCEPCKYHQETTTLLARPQHCSRPMEVEAWVSLHALLTNVPPTVDLRRVLRED